MSRIEDLIVAMKFDNKQFEAGVKISMVTLAALKGSLNFGGASKGIDEAQAAVGRFSMAGMGAGVDGMSAKFMALSTVAITALSNITNKAVDAGMNMAKSLTVQPVMDGFAEYELKMGSIQTILSNTSKAGTTLDQVTASLDNLNTYADKTIYNFGDMTKNIGLFTNAGIGIEDATSMIKGFSNEAAASGTSAEGASGAAYQLSQALSAGTIRLMDWRSLTNVGMGNKNMQNGIVEIADAMGVLDEKAISSEAILKDFNGSLEKEWLSADVMQNYLKIQAGELSDEQMKGLGLSEDQIVAFKKQAAIAQEAATKIRTWTQLIGTLREGVGSSWAQTFDILLGDFDQATELFTGIYDTLGPMIDSFGNARNKLLQGWADAGGREQLLGGLLNGFKALMSVLTPIGQAFQQIFPPMTVAALLNMTAGFQRFTASLILGGETADKVKRTFAGVFAIFGIGWEVVKALFGGLMNLFGGLQGGAGGFLSLTAAVGDWLVSVHAAIKSGDGLSNLFGGLGTILTLPIRMIAGLASGIGTLLGGLGDLGSTAKMVFDIFATGDFKGGPFEEDSQMVDTLFDIREALVKVGATFTSVWNTITKGDFTGGGFWEEDSPIVSGLLKFHEMLKGMFDPGILATVLGAGAAGGLALVIRNVIKKGIDRGFGAVEGLFDTIKGVFDSVKGTFDGLTDLFGSLTGALTTMQNNIKANIILKIAIAVGVLAVSLKLLSTIDAGDLGKALGAVTVAMAQLMGAMAVLARVAGSAGFLALPSIAGALVSLSIAVLILSVAVKNLSSMSWEELAKGLGGLAVILGVVVLAAMGLSKVQGSILRTAFALIPLAIGINLLVIAVKNLAELSWGELAKGIAGLAGALVAIGVAMRLMPAGMPGIGAGLLLVGAGMAVVVFAIKQMGNMDTAELVQGILGLGGALIAIAVALRLMPANMIAIGAGLLLVAVALQGVSAAVMIMGSMSWEDLAKGLVGLGGSLGILAIALTFMNSTVAGSAALMLAAAAIAMLVPPLIMMAALSWSDLLQGLVGLGGILAVLGVAGLLLTPVVPVLLALGAALILLGAGMAMLGLGAQAIVAALMLFVTLINHSKAALIGLMDMIPLMAAAMAQGIITFATTITNGAAEIVGAFKALLSQMLDAVIELVPKIGAVITTIILTICQIVVTNAPAIATAVAVLVLTFVQTVTNLAPTVFSAVFDMMMGFLRTIRDRIPEVVTVVAQIIVAFINGIANNLDSVIQSAFNLIITFINGLTTAINNNAESLRAAGRGLAFAIADGMTGGLLSRIDSVATGAANLGRRAIAAAKAAIDSNSPSKEFYKIGQYAGDGLVLGLDKSGPAVGYAAHNMGTTILDGVRDTLQSRASGLTHILQEAAGTAKDVWSMLTRGDFLGSGVWEEDDPMVDHILDIHDAFKLTGGTIKDVWSMLSKGDFLGSGIWEEDDPMVDHILDIRDAFVGAGASAETAAKKFFEMTKLDVIFDPKGPLLTKINAFGPNIALGFKDVGGNIVEGLRQGVANGQKNWNDMVGSLGTGALTRIREVLGIRSPSREFEKVGEYSADGLVNGVNKGAPAVKEAGANLATNLFMGFTKGAGGVIPKALESVFKTLETGTADARFWGPNSPATQELLGFHKILVDLELQMAAFYGEVNLSDPTSIEAYAEKAGDSLQHLSGLFAGLKEAAGTAFGMLAKGEGLDAVIGNEDFLSQIVNSLLTLLPGVQGAAVSIGLAIVDGLLSTFMGPGTTLLGIVGDFLSGAVRWIGGLFGIKFPEIEKEVEKGEKAVEDFLVTVEDGHGRFQKLTEAGIEALTTSLSNVQDLLDQGDTSPRITPVLDLTEFNKDRASMMNQLDAPIDISLSRSSAQADGVYKMQQDLKEMQTEVQVPVSNTTIEYTQNNNSPKALSHIEIYRQTKSQLSMVKEALKV